MQVTLWTDGSSHLGTLHGGWAYAITRDDTLLSQGRGAATGTTNNRMELQAVIEGLRDMDPRQDAVTVVSDSAYVVNCMLQGWYKKWRRNGWRTAEGKVKNQDLWEELTALVEAFHTPVEWVHIRGHRGSKWNEYCDELAGKARLSLTEA